MTAETILPSRLLPEWAPQEAIILAWPDSQTDWAPWLADVRETYVSLISAIVANDCGVILLIREQERASFLDLWQGTSGVLLIDADYNDTWVRDYGFLTCQSSDGKMRPMEFIFNGWGNKFDAQKDNAINQSVLTQVCQQPIHHYPLVMEGGALEIDQHGHLLSTALCLENPQRNGELSLSDYAQHFQTTLGADKVSVLENGHLEGDDTDGHIDTLVRFTDDNGLVIQSAFNRPQDSHFEGLKALVDECQTLMPTHKIFELPLPEIVNDQGERLPASYANFLINNGQILFPIYQQQEDELALQVIGQAYPDYKIVPINSLPLVQQFGSIHCISMQVPYGTLTPQAMDQF